MTLRAARKIGRAGAVLPCLLLRARAVGSTRAARRPAQGAGATAARVASACPLAAPACTPARMCRRRLARRSQSSARALTANRLAVATAACGLRLRRRMATWGSIGAPCLCRAPLPVAPRPCAVLGEASHRLLRLRTPAPLRWSTKRAMAAAAMLAARPALHLRS